MCRLRSFLSFYKYTLSTGWTDKRVFFSAGKRSKSTKRRRNCLHESNVNSLLRLTHPGHWTFFLLQLDIVFECMRILSVTSLQFPLNTFMRHCQAYYCICAHSLHCKSLEFPPNSSASSLTWLPMYCKTTPIEYGWECHLGCDCYFCWWIVASCR